MGIKENIKKVKEEIPKDIILLAATKRRSISEIEEAIQAGIDTIGENYMQEAEDKYLFLKRKVKIHCIGHLQTNKVKKAVEIFDMIETVDSIRLAKEIDKRAKNIGRVMPVLIEVNIAKEDNKDGIYPEKVMELAKEITNLKNLRLSGLMTMAPYFENSEKTRPYFKDAKKIYDKIKDSFPEENIRYLSMGMSNSYKEAIASGANMIRLGTTLFGPRD